MTVTWEHLHQDVLAEFAALGAVLDLGALTIVRAQDLRPRVDIVDLDAYERELALSNLAKRRRTEREAREHTKREDHVYANKLRRDAAGSRTRRAARAAALVRPCRQCKQPLQLTPRTVHRRYCSNLCKHRYWGARKKTA